MKNKRGLLLLMAVAAMLMLGGCGVKVNNKTPENVVKSLISAYQGQDQKAVKKCFGLDPKEDCEEEIQKEIEYNLNLFAAHDAEKVSFEKAKSLGESDKKEMIYVLYNYEIKNKKETQEVPALSFYYVQKKDKKYYVVPAKDVTEEMSRASGEKYEEFVKTEDYKAYNKKYKNFIRKNPKYENGLEERFQEVRNKTKRKQT